MELLNLSRLDHQLLRVHLLQELEVQLQLELIDLSDYNLNFKELLLLLLLLLVRMVQVEFHNSLQQVIQMELELVVELF